MSTIEHHCYFSRVLQRETIEPIPGREDWLQISFLPLKKKTLCVYDDPTDCTCEESSVPPDRIGLSIHYSCPDHRQRYTAAFQSFLSRMGIPQPQHSTILDKVFQAILTAYPQQNICVLIADVTVRFLGSFHDLVSIERIMLLECHNCRLVLNYWHGGELRSETHTLRAIDYHGRLSLGSLGLFVPATRSSIESLQQVRLDSLEEATIKRNLSCCICKDDFGADQLVIPLPCTHCYHVGCIFSWLEVNHLCPLCRYAMPFVEQGEPSYS